MPVKSHKSPQSASSRERSGKPQTTYSKRMVRNCLAKLEADCGRQNLAFNTFTLPDLPEADMTQLRNNWGEVCRQLMQAIARDLERAGISPRLVYINEIQENRYQKTGVIAPHIHVVFQSRKSRYHPYAISKERNTELWNRVLSNVVGHEVKAPSGARIEAVKKSAERYMSKYMSKGANLAQKLMDEGHRAMLPKQWWGATITLRNWVKDNCKILSETSKAFIRDNYKQFLSNLKESPFSWLYVHTIKLLEPHGEEVEFPVAIVGKVRPSWMSTMEFIEPDDMVTSWEW